MHNTSFVKTEVFSEIVHTIYYGWCSEGVDLMWSFVLSQIEDPIFGAPRNPIKGASRDDCNDALGVSEHPTQGDWHEEPLNHPI